MKNLFLLLTLLPFFFSCGGNSGEDNIFNSTLKLCYEIDTVRVDSKGEFLFLNMGLFMSDYDPNSDLLYNLNPQTSRMEVIDMDKLALRELIQYDQDGPNAVKEMFTSGIKITESGERWFTDYLSIIHLNGEGEKIGQFQLDEDDFAGDTLPNELKIDGMGKITRSGKYFVSHYGDYVLGGKGLQGLAVIDLESRTKKLFLVDVFKSLKKYDLSSPDGERAGARAGEWNFISLVDKEIIHSNSAQNRLLSLNLSSGEQREVKLKSMIVQDEKPGLYPKKANSVEQFNEFNELKKQELTFGPWIHDYERGYFWRISREQKGDSVENPVFSFVITVWTKT